MIIISNTSPIFYLAAINHLDLLNQIYDEIIIPTAVFNEITNVGNPDPIAIVFPTLVWIKVQGITDRRLVTQLSANLDLGEAEAIALATELNADRLLIDERLGRSVAKGLGVKVTGVLGVLIAAKRNHLIPTVKPLLDNLINQAGFWVDIARLDPVRTFCRSSNPFLVGNAHPTRCPNPLPTLLYTALCRSFTGRWRISLDENSTLAHDHRLAPTTNCFRQSLQR